MFCNLTATSIRVDYEPAESRSGMFGGNSNWRGPVWFPVNYLLIESLQKFDFYYGDDFKVEFPTGSGKMLTLWEVSQELSKRLSRIFLKDEDGTRAVYGNTEKFQTDENWRDYILFYEYFHGDNGARLGRKSSNRLDGTGRQNYCSRSANTVMRKRATTRKRPFAFAFRQKKKIIKLG